MDGTGTQSTQGVETSRIIGLGKQPMIDAVLNLLFSCRHRRITRPITPVRKPSDPRGETYVACLECGKQFYYDVANMRVGMPIPPPPQRELGTVIG
jgi:hypothetical protein